MAFGIVDLSLAPTPQVGDSVGEILQAMGVKRLGGPGSTAALALLNDAVKKGGSFASSSVGGLSGAFVAVSEDKALADAVESGDLTLAKLEAMTAVCSVGLDMIAVPGDTDAATLSALMADEVAIGVINHKTTATRLIPVPGKKAGERAVFGGLFGEMIIIPVHAAGRQRRVRRPRRPDPRPAVEPAELRRGLVVAGWGTTFVSEGQGLMERSEAETAADPSRIDPAAESIPSPAQETAVAPPPIRYGPSGRRLYTLDELPPRVRLRVENYGKWVAWSADQERIVAAAATFAAVDDAVIAAGLTGVTYEWLGD